MDNQIKLVSIGISRIKGWKMPQDIKIDIQGHLREKGMEDVKKPRSSADIGVLQNIIKHCY